MKSSWKSLYRQLIILLSVFSFCILGQPAFFPVFNTAVPDFSAGIAAADDTEGMSEDLYEKLDDFFGDDLDMPSNGSENDSHLKKTVEEPENSGETEYIDDFFDDGDGTELLKPNDPAPDEFEPDGSKDGVSEYEESEYGQTEISRSASRIRLSGDLWIESGYRFNYDSPAAGQADHRGLSDLSTGLRLELSSKLFNSWKFFISGSGEHDFAYKLNNTKYTQDFLDDNEQEIELEQAYLQGSLSERLDLKFGRQIVVWGKSDNIRITDILNPLDMREPGKTDIEDLRLPVFMSHIGYYISNLNLSLYLIHEHRSHQRPVFGSPYYFFDTALPDSKTPAHSLENTEIAGSMNINFHGMDISVYLSSVFDDMPYMDADGELHHERLYMAGTAFNRAAGNFLFKAETAMFDGIRLSALQTGAGLVKNSKDYKRLDSLLGVEYSGFENTSLSLEVADRWLLNHDLNAAKSNNDEQTYQYALRWSRSFFNEVMEISLLSSFYGERADDGGFTRIQADYDLTDNMELSFGEITYESGSLNHMKDIGGNDMLFTRLTYSF